MSVAAPNKPSKGSWFDQKKELIRGEENTRRILAALGFTVFGKEIDCPFCGEKEFKFNVNQMEKGGCGCDKKSCKKFGDAIAFWKEFKRLETQSEALKEILVLLGMESHLPQKGKNKKQESGPLDDPYNTLEFLAWNDAKAQLWAMRHKPNITSEALLRLGTKFARHEFQVEWDSNGKCIKYEKTHVFAIPVWGAGGPDADPIAWRVIRCDGKPFPNKNPKKKPNKIKHVGPESGKGNNKGVVGPIDLLKLWFAGDLPAEFDCVKLEGETDLLRLLSEREIANLLFWTNNTGVGDSAPPDWLVKLHRNRVVYILHDPDNAGQDPVTLNRLFNRFQGTAKRIHNVRLPSSDYAVDDGNDLRFYLDHGHSIESIEELIRTSKPLEAAGGEDTRAVIKWTDNEEHLVQEINKVMASHPELYLRGTRVVEAMLSPNTLKQSKNDSRDELVLTIRELEPPQMRTRATGKIRFVSHSRNGDESTKTATDGIARQVLAYGHYPDFRVLKAISETPFLRPDGSICNKNGFDEQTGTLLQTSLVIDVKEEPTRQDAIAAANRLLDLCVDFEYKKPCHRSAWLATLLTVFARQAIDGPIPLSVFEASSQGAGKTRQVDMISIIATGRTLSRNIWPGRDEETSKLLLSIGLAGLQMVLFDNCKATLGGQAIEAAATSDFIKGRLLGENKETGELPLKTLFMFTANNSHMTADFARRACVCRLEPSTDAPDERSGFKYKDILKHIKQNRSQYASDALTILRAFMVGGGGVSLQNWGSFEEYSKIVRAAIVWLGLADPFEGTKDAKASELAEDLFPEIVQELTAVGVGDVGMTAGEILRIANEREEYTGRPVHPTLLECLNSAAGDKKLSSFRLAKIFHKYEGRVLSQKISGEEIKTRFLSEQDPLKNQKRWCLRDITYRSPELPELNGVLAELIQEKEGSEGKQEDAHINPIGTRFNSGNSGLRKPLCEPNAHDVVEVADKDGPKQVCRRCGKFIGRVKRSGDEKGSQPPPAAPRLSKAGSS